MRQTITYGQPLETSIGFSRACRVGNHVAVSGTAPIAPGGGVAAPGDMYGQTRRCLEIIADVLAQAGASMAQVVKTRVLVTDISRWEEAARAHGEFFAEVKPASLFAEVSRFIHPDWLVEVEAEAIIPD